MAHYHHGNLRESLIQAGDDELRVSRDFSLRALSRRLNVSHNAPYRHFSDKNALIEEILTRTLRELTDRLQEAELLYPLNPLHQIQYFGRAWALLSLRHPRKVELLFGSLRQALTSGNLKIQFDHMNTALEARLHDLTAAKALLSAYMGASLLVSSGGVDDLAEEEVFSLFDFAAENLLKTDGI